MTITMTNGNIEIVAKMMQLGQSQVSEDRESPRTPTTLDITTIAMIGHQTRIPILSMCTMDETKTTVSMTSIATAAEDTKAEAGAEVVPVALDLRWSLHWATRARISVRYQWAEIQADRRRHQQIVRTPAGESTLAEGHLPQELG
jgi:hypothetical protein